MNTRKLFSSNKTINFTLTITLITILNYLLKKRKKCPFFTHHRITQEKEKENTKKNQVGLRSKSVGQSLRSSSKSNSSLGLLYGLQ